MNLVRRSGRRLDLVARLAPTLERLVEILRPIQAPCSLLYCDRSRHRCSVHQAMVGERACGGELALKCSRRHLRRVSAAGVERDGVRITAAPRPGHGLTGGDEQVPRFELVVFDGDRDSGLGAVLSLQAPTPAIAAARPAAIAAR